MMIALQGQEDSLFAVLAVCCAIFVAIYMISSKSMSDELRKPFVAVFAATTIGILIYASQSLVFVVIMNSLIVVSTIQGARLASMANVSLSGQAEGAVIQSVSPRKWDLAFRGLTVGIALLLIAAPLGYRFMGQHKSAKGAAVPTPMVPAATSPVTASVPQAVSPAPVDSQPAQPTAPVAVPTESTGEESRQTALSHYQQAKIEHDASIHTLDAAWQHLGKVSTKSAMSSWKNTQALWAKSKHDTCGKPAVKQDIDALSVTALDAETRLLQCERDANINRATYLSNNAYTVSEEKGHVDDDIGNLISKLKQQ